MGFPTPFQVLRLIDQLETQQDSLQIVRYSTEFPGFRVLVIDQIGVDGVRQSRRWIDAVTGTSATHIQSSLPRRIRTRIFRLFFVHRRKSIHSLEMAALI
jgi:hypothetical protein